MAKAFLLVSVYLDKLLTDWKFVNFFFSWLSAQGETLLLSNAILWKKAETAKTHYTFFLVNKTYV